MRRAAVGVLAGTLAFTGGAIAAGASPANAVEGFAFERLAGADRYATAAAIARDTFQTANTVVLASGEERNFPDALTGNYLAGDVQGPILLTRTASLPDATRSALTGLQVQRVIIVGGTSAVSSDVEAELRRLGLTVERLGGIDRYATAELVAMQVGENTTSTSVGEDSQGRRTAILGNGQNFPDILAAGPISYAEQFPIAITRPSDLPANTEDVLRDLGIERVIIVGGETAVSTAVENEVDAFVQDVDRIAGQTRFETATDLADFAYAELGFNRAHINLATGEKFADALSGGPHAGEDRAPIVLTFSNTLQPVTRAFLEANCPTLIDGHIFGGPVAVSNEVEAQAEAAASSCDAPVEQPPTATVESNDTTVAPGGDFVGTVRVEGENITNVAVSGSCINNDADLTETGTAGGEEFGFSIPIRSDAAAGQCTLTFTVSTVGNEDIVVTRTITIEATQETPTSTISVTPDTEETRTVTMNPESTNDDADNRTFQVSGLTSGETFRITLVRCENIQGQGREALFRASADANSSTGFSADTGSPSADIVAVNGNNIGDQSTDAGFQSGTTTFVANGTTATFTIDGDAVECVVPVVYFDATTADTSEGGNSNRLEVEATQTGQFGRAVEDVDTGGETNFEAAATGPVNAAATVRPELIDADIVRTATAEQANASTTDNIEEGTVVRFTFDEEITGVQGINEALFHVFDQDGTQFDGQADSTIETGGNSVLVRFLEINNATLAADLTVATVDFGAVFDNEGDENPIGDAPLGTSSEGTTTGFTAGETQAPDLLAIGGFTGNPDNVNETLVTFTFDEAAFTVNPNGFSLITIGGEEIVCLAVQGQAGGQPLVTENADTTIQVACPESLFGRDITEADIARGIVEVDTVSDTRQDTGVAGAEGATNPLQASNTPDVNSTDPDLVSAELRFNADQTTATTDTVVFTFDEPVLVGTQTAFLVFDVNGDQVAATSAARSTENANVVIATFADTVIDDAVGASVQDGAVTAQTGTARANEEDEVGVQNAGTNSTTPAQTAGRTDNPDLIEVRVESNTTTGAAEAVFVFDEDVQVVDRNGEFFLVQADGTRLVCANDNVTVGNNETATTNPDTDNEVRCTQFTVADPATGAATSDIATSAQVREAVVGTVDDDAVIGETDVLETGIDPTTGGDTGLGNPEGAELLLGSTGTRTA